MGVLLVLRRDELRFRYLPTTQGRIVNLWGPILGFRLLSRVDFMTS